MTWKNCFKEGQELVLATSSNDGCPNANIVLSRGFIEDKLVIINAQMNKTIKNLKENKFACLIGKSNLEYFRLKGKVEIFNSGKYFNIYKTKTKHPAKSIILITIEEVFDLDKVKRVL